MQEWEAGQPERDLLAAEQLKREQDCPKHEYKDIGGFLVATLKCKLCGHQTIEDY